MYWVNITHFPQDVHNCTLEVCIEWTSPTSPKMCTTVLLRYSYIESTLSPMLCCRCDMSSSNQKINTSSLKMWPFRVSSNWWHAGQFALIYWSPLFFSIRNFTSSTVKQQPFKARLKTTWVPHPLPHWWFQCLRNSHKIQQMAGTISETCLEMDLNTFCAAVLFLLQQLLLTRGTELSIPSHYSFATQNLSNPWPQHRSE